MNARAGSLGRYVARRLGNAAFYADMRARYGLDQPLITQLGQYIITTLHGDFGYSFSYQQPVLQVILSRLPATLLLMGTAIMLSTVIGLRLGVVTAIRPHSALDHGIAAFTLTAYAMPVFWLRQLLVLLFAVRLNLLPVQGMVTVRESYTGIHHVLDVIRHLTLPAATLGLPQLALPPIITLAAPTVGGAILVEAGLSFFGLGDRNVVSWGALLNDAQQFVRRAWWLSAFPGLAITLTVLGMNLLADGLNEAWNPRLSRR